MESVKRGYNMIIQIDENDNVIGYSIYSLYMEPDEHNIEIDELVVPDDFFKDYLKYSYRDKKLCKHSTLSSREQENIRSKRIKECFSIINRGKAWYDMLDAEEKEELGKWYHEWLDATATGVIPDLPSFLDASGKIIS